MNLPLEFGIANDVTGDLEEQELEMGNVMVLHQLQALINYP